MDLDELNRKAKFFSSWSASLPEFQPVLDELRRNPPARAAEAGLINVSSGKYVWRLRLGGFDFAYKSQDGKKPWRYWLRPSLPLRETRNYQRFAALGLPVPRVLAVGDTRKFFQLRESFIITEFIPDTKDGRALMPGGAAHADAGLRRQFAARALAMLATLHQAEIFHKAFHPRNILWRPGAAGPELFLIDIARCRGMSPAARQWETVFDLHTFFKDMRFSRQETSELLAAYRDARAAAPWTAEELRNALFTFRRRRGEPADTDICCD